ncbi:MAG: Dabb family protein [Gammaproteobacteria bacterium]|nr:Dabb family protein [Gammaproteobacteria bacterium]
MLKHIVMWRVRATAERTREENAAGMKRALEALRGRVPGLLAIEVGINAIPGGDASDVVLYSEFADREALAAYQKHPEHEPVAEFVKEVRVERRVVDYEA